MDQEQLQEWKYRYEERLGIMCGSDVPTERQIQIAKQEADQAVKHQKPSLSSQIGPGSL